MRVSHCFGVCALLAALTSASSTMASPAVQPDLGATQLSNGNLNNLVHFEAAHLVDGNPNFIEPCWLVNKNFFDSASPTAYSFHVTIHFTSHGRHFSRRMNILLRDVVVVSPNDPDHDHGTFDTTKWVRVRTTFDVTRHPVDAGTPIEGKVRLAKVHHHDDDGDDGDGDHDDDDDGGSDASVGPILTAS